MSKSVDNQSPNQNYYANKEFVGNPVINSNPNPAKHHFNDAYSTIMIINIVFSAIGLLGFALFYFIYFWLIIKLPGFNNNAGQAFLNALFTAFSILFVYKLILNILNIIFSAISLNQRTTKYFVAINVFLWLSLTFVSFALAIAMLVTRDRYQQRFYYNSPQPANNQIPNSNNQQFSNS